MGSIAYVGLVDEARSYENDKIVKEILEENHFNNFTNDDALSVCKKVDKGTGERYKNCLKTLKGTDDKDIYSYWKAVGRGFKGTLADFKGRKAKLSKVGSLLKSGASLGMGLLSKTSNQGDSVDYSQNTDINTPKTLSKGAKIGIAFGVVAVLSGIAFLIFKKHKK